MPNWSYNHYAVKSATKNVLNFVNEGLKNMGIEPKNNIKDAVDTLWNNEVSLSTFRPIPETFLKWDTTNRKKDKDAKDFRTKEPLFKTEEEYEEYSHGYDEAVKFQKETYGVVGWYDYNSFIGFGTKWDSEVELEDVLIDEKNGTTTIFMKGETAWCYPTQWLRYIKGTFDLNVFLCAHEEFDRYNFFCEIDGEVIGNYDYNDIKSLENCPKKDDFNSCEDYCTAYFKFKDNMDKTLDNNYYDYVKNFNVNGDVVSEDAAV